MSNISQIVKLANLLSGYTKSPLSGGASTPPPAAGSMKTVEPIKPIAPLVAPKSAPAMPTSPLPPPASSSSAPMTTPKMPQLKTTTGPAPAATKSAGLGPPPKLSLDFPASKPVSPPKPPRAFKPDTNKIKPVSPFRKGTSSGST